MKIEKKNAEAEIQEMMVVASVTQVELEMSKQVLRTGDSYWVFGDKKGDGRKDYICILVWAVWPN